MIDKSIKNLDYSKVERHEKLKRESLNRK